MQWKDLFFTLNFSCLGSQNKEKEKLRQGKHPINKNWERMNRDACCSLWAHHQTAFSVFPVLYSILVRVMWFFTLLNVRGISTVTAHIQARICRSVRLPLKQKLLEERQSPPTLTESVSYTQRHHSSYVKYTICVTLKPCVFKHSAFLIGVFYLCGFKWENVRVEKIKNWSQFVSRCKACWSPKTNRSRLKWEPVKKSSVDKVMGGI